MKIPKICVPICGKSPDEMIHKAARAAEFADVIELRFDCLSPASIPEALLRLNEVKSTLLITYRPSEQGGKRVLTPADRVKFWTMASKHLHETDHYADLELDLATGFGIPAERTIRSVHYFNGIEPSGSINHDLVESFRGTILKVAAKVTDFAEAIPLWNLLIEQQSAGEECIPIAMGEAGKWTRILGPAHGAFMTYAALDGSSETAPGQILAEELTNIFRFRDITRASKIYGIIAGNTSYSMSPYIHNAAFAAAEMDRVFVPFQVNDLAGFVTRMVRAESREIDLNIKGFSVTNPHKRNIMQFLDEIDVTAEKIGAVNTVLIEDGKLKGYNTDADGFIQPLQDHYGDIADSQAHVYGSGGAARACVYALKQAGANVSVVARNETAGRSIADEFGVSYLMPDSADNESRPDIVVNATPLGTKGESEDRTILTSDQLKGVGLVYDLTYNPSDTLLLKAAKEAGCRTIGGMEMLIRQAVRQFELWTGETPSIEAMKTAATRRLEK